jgi:hypothetical protein
MLLSEESLSWRGGVDQQRRRVCNYRLRFVSSNPAGQPPAPPGPEAPKEPPAKEKLLAEIRDILKSQQRSVQP